MPTCARIKENQPRIKIKILTPCSLTSRMRPPPVSDHLTSWMVAYVWDTRILIGYATTSRTRPLDILVGRLRVGYAYTNRVCDHLP